MPLVCPICDLGVTDKTWKAHRALCHPHDLTSQPEQRERVKPKPSNPTPLMFDPKKSKSAQDYD